MPKLFVEIKKDLKQKLIIKCAMQGRTIKEVISELVEKWVKK